MDVFVAAQPIFNRKMDVAAYEILYRKNKENRFFQEDPNVATSDVMMNTFNVIGLDVLTNNKPAFINFTEKFLEEEMATLFPNDKLVVEILEDVNPTDIVVEQVRKLKSKGYTIALDDFIYDSKFDELIDLANIIKIDFMQSSYEEMEELINKKRNIKYLAEKIETMEDFEDAMELGFEYFQGYFFSKPVMHKSRDISVIQSNHINLLAELSKETFNIDEISNIISSDLALSYKLLKLVNSIQFSFRTEITSIKKAIIAIGELGIKKWATLLVVKDLGSEKPDELIKLSLVRAKMAEYIGDILGREFDPHDLFLMGLFTTIDAMVDLEMSEVLDSIPLKDSITKALLEHQGKYGYIYNLLEVYEQQNYEKVSTICEELALDESDLADSYIHAIQWYKQIISQI
jgi:EAL and modified HD-GYP domain-containing signal transduction protein